MTNKEQLAKDLLSAFNDFQSNAPTPGGSENANKYVADKLADAIADGIERGARISFKGAKSAVEINSLPLDQKQAGDMYLCTTSGRLNGKTPLDVSENTAVIWDGESWNKFIEIDLSDYYTKAETEAVATTIATASATAAVATEASEREAGDMALDLRINAKEDVANKSQSVDDSSTSYPSGAAVKVYVAEETAEIIETLEDETTARQVADELLQGQIDELSQTQTDWDEDDSSSLAYLKNHPQPISALDIEALFS